MHITNGFIYGKTAAATAVLSVVGVGLALRQVKRELPLRKGPLLGLARKAVEQEDKVFQIYFTGCAGDVTVGKYNDTSPAAKADLTQHLKTAMKAAIAATRMSAGAPRLCSSVPFRFCWENVNHEKGA